MNYFFIIISAGQEEFDAITKAYYRGAQACVLTFSTTDYNSFEAVKEWKMKVMRIHCPNRPTKFKTTQKSTKRKSRII